MKRLFYLFALVVTIFIFGTTAAFGQASLMKGFVNANDVSGPMCGVTVLALSVDAKPVVLSGTVTDECGYFEIAVNRSKFRLQFSYIGYEQLTMPGLKAYYTQSETVTVMLTRGGSANAVSEEEYESLLRVCDEYAVANVGYVAEYKRSHPELYDENGQPKLQSWPTAEEWEKTFEHWAQSSKELYGVDVKELSATADWPTDKEWESIYKKSFSKRGVKRGNAPTFQEFMRVVEKKQPRS